jgi:hypothetical protein
LAEAVSVVVVAYSDVLARTRANDFRLLIKEKYSIVNSTPSLATH